LALRINRLDLCRSAWRRLMFAVNCASLAFRCTMSAASSFSCSRRFLRETRPLARKHRELVHVADSTAAGARASA